MVAKTIFMLLLFFVPLTFINLGLVTSAVWLFPFYILSGLGMAGIGMGIMHDAIHGSYSKSKRINKIMGYTLNLIGANSKVWRIQHNILHHTYTNIDEADDDINTPFFLRFSPHAKRNWLHRFQFIYVWFFYSVSTFFWVTTKDFVRLNRYRKLGLLPPNEKFNQAILKIAGWKLLYFTYALILPMVIVPMAPWWIFLAFLSMHMVTGLLISIVFQVAHIMPNTSFPAVNGEGSIEGNWHAHQLATTSNFSPRGKWFSWLIGGLNYQVEHHLLPSICHVHYKKLSKIVKATAEEFKLPYHVKPTFILALRDHTRMLRQLGKA
jgi:linoleoyl-CoA desaturase